MNPALELKDLQSQQLVTVTENGLTFGREGGKAEMKLPDRGVSSMHCKIVCERGTYYVEDLGSTNGTFVDGKKITQKTALKPGTALALFRYRFEVLGVEARGAEDVTGTRQKQVATNVLPPEEGPQTKIVHKGTGPNTLDPQLRTDAHPLDPPPSAEKPKPVGLKTQNAAATQHMPSVTKPKAKPSRLITKIIVGMWVVCGGAMALLLWPESGPDASPETNHVAVKTSEDPPPPPPVAEKPPETPPAAPPPPPPKEDPPRQNGKTPFPQYAEKRKSVEDKITGDPTILKSKHGVLPLYRKLAADTKKVQAKHKKKKADKVDELLQQAQVYEATHKTVDELYHLLFE